MRSSVQPRAFGNPGVATPIALTRRGEPSGARLVVLAARALLFLRHPRVLRLRPAAPRAHQELRAVDDGGVKVRVETTVRVHLRVTDVVSVRCGLAADRAGAWHRGHLLRGTELKCYSRAHR